MTDTNKSNNETLSLFQKVKQDCLEHPRAFLNAAIISGGLAAGLLGYNKELFSSTDKPTKAFIALAVGAAAYRTQRQRDNLNVQRRKFQLKQNETPEQRDRDKMMTMLYGGTVITSALPLVATVNPVIGLMPLFAVVADSFLEYIMTRDDQEKRKELQNKIKNKKVQGPER